MHRNRFTNAGDDHRDRYEEFRPQQTGRAAGESGWDIDDANPESSWMDRQRAGQRYAGEGATSQRRDQGMRSDFERERGTFQPGSRDFGAGAQGAGYQGGWESGQRYQGGSQGGRDGYQGQSWGQDWGRQAGGSQGGYGQQGGYAQQFGQPGYGQSGYGQSRPGQGGYGQGGHGYSDPQQHGAGRYGQSDRGYDSGQSTYRDWAHEQQGAGAYGALGGSRETGWFGREQGWSGDAYGSGGRGGPREQTHIAKRRPPKGYTRSDERIKEDVNDRLMQTWDLDPSDLEVAVSEGEVTLSGEVRSRNEKFLAEQMAESVLGVKDVLNQLRLRRAGAETNAADAGGAKAGASGSAGASTSSNSTADANNKQRSGYGASATSPTR